MKKILLLILMCWYVYAFAQNSHDKLSLAIKNLEADTQCEHGIISLYVINSKTGKIVFDKNGSIGLAPASCQKIITSASVFELLGKEYTYKTTLSYGGIIDSGLLKGNLYVNGNGDPTLGSWRYDKTKENMVLNLFIKAIKDAGIKQISGNIITDNSNWETQIIPGGWIWEDIGNYYGAGASAVNWRENQYDLILRSGKKIGDSVKIIGTEPAIVQGLKLVSELTSAKAGSGDNSVIYFAPGDTIGYVRGTIPVNEDHFVISGSMPDGAMQLSMALYDIFKKASSHTTDKISEHEINQAKKIFYTYTSPTLDSIDYWFLKKSINLYGEALLKTISLQKTNFASTDTGVNIIKDFWSKRGIEKTALNIIDGSGLSPANRVTATALTYILQYAKKQNWFTSFYNALPEIHNIKMKSGSIGGVASYTGYIKSRTGADYTFAFIINNYNGNGSAIREKMWKVLDTMK